MTKFVDSNILKSTAIALLSVLGFLVVSTVFNFLSIDDTVLTIQNAKIDIRGISEDITNLPKTIQSNSDMLLTYQLDPSNRKRNQSISFKSSYNDIIFWVDDHLIYEFYSDKNQFVKSGGTYIHMVEIPNYLDAEKIQILFINNLAYTNTFKLPSLEVGEADRIYFMHLISEDLFDYLMMILLTIVYIVLLILHFAFFNKLKNKHNAIQIVLMCLWIIGYAIVQLWTFNYAFRDYHTIIYVVEFYLIMLVPIPVIFIIRGHSTKTFNLVIEWLLILLSLNIMIQTVLMLFTEYELKDFHAITLVLDSLSIIVFLAFFYVTNQNTCSNKADIMKSIWPLVMSFTISIIIYINFSEVAFMDVVMISIIFFSVNQLRNLLNIAVGIRDKNIENKLYQKLAYTDVMTGLANRSAYERDQKSGIFLSVSKWIIVIDLNDLKYINDHYGHDAGDKYITMFGSVLLNLEKDDRSVQSYRVGGDEFIIIINSIDKDAVKNYQSKLLDFCQNVHIDFGQKYKVSFAMGSAFYDCDSDYSFSQKATEADGLMYQNKAGYKQRENYAKTLATISN